MAAECYCLAGERANLMVTATVLHSLTVCNSHYGLSGPEGKHRLPRLGLGRSQPFAAQHTLALLVFHWHVARSNALSAP